MAWVATQYLVHEPSTPPSWTIVTLPSSCILDIDCQRWPNYDNSGNGWHVHRAILAVVNGRRTCPRDILDRNFCICPACLIMMRMCFNKCRSYMRWRFAMNDESGRREIIMHPSNHPQSPINKRTKWPRAHSKLLYRRNMKCANPQPHLQWWLSYTTLDKHIPHKSQCV